MSFSMQNGWTAHECQCRCVEYTMKKLGIFALPLLLMACAPNSDADSQRRDLANSAKVEAERVTFPAAVLEGYEQLDAHGEPRQLLEMIENYERVSKKDPEKA